MRSRPPTIVPEADYPVTRRYRVRSGEGRGFVFLLVASILLGALPIPGALATPGRGTGAGAIVHRTDTQPGPGGSELDGLSIAPIDASVSPDVVMHHRPFILDQNAYPAFRQDAVIERLDTTAGRERLQALLIGRNVDPATVTAALARYDDPAVIEIIPSPSLRVALLMMTDWEPYAVVISTILDGQNQTNRPYASIVFGDTRLDAAVAVLTQRDGTIRLVIDDRYAFEPPEQLMPVLVHESLHGGDDNSVEEEAIATILNIVAYADLLLQFPDVATYGTKLTAYNNVFLMALINSTGVAGPGQLGISDSPRDDVWLGTLLEEIDARSMRDAVTGDSIYGGVPTGGSAGQATLAELLKRVTGPARLAPMPDFDEAILEVIDRRIGDALPPSDVVRLATLLGLDVIAG